MRFSISVSGVFARLPREMATQIGWFYGLRTSPYNSEIYVSSFTWKYTCFYRIVYRYEPPLLTNKCIPERIILPRSPWDFSVRNMDLLFIEMWDLYSIIFILELVMNRTDVIIILCIYLIYIYIAWLKSSLVSTE